MSIRSPRNFQLDSWHPARLFLFINLVTCILTVASAGLVSGHRPIGPNLSAIFFATVLGSLAFAIPLRTVRVGYRVVAVVAIGAGAVLYVYWPAISTGATITTSGDASNYAAFAQYLFRYARDTVGNLAPIDQYASFFSDTRFATPSVLSVFTWFCNSDPGFALGPFIALLLVNIFAGFTLLARQVSCTIPTSLLVGASVLLLGWVPNMIYLGSLDNLFFLAVLPFVLVRLHLMLVGGTKVRSILAFAITLAALFYDYPEGVLMASAIFLPVVIAVAIHAWKKREILTRLCWLAAIAPLLAVPYLHTFVAFLSRQFHTTSQLMLFTDGVFPGSSNKSVYTSHVRARTRIPRRGLRSARRIIVIASGRIYYFRAVAMATNPPTILLVICMLFIDSSLTRSTGAPQLRNLQDPNDWKRIGRPADLYWNRRSLLPPFP